MNTITLKIKNVFTIYIFTVYIYLKMKTLIQFESENVI